MDPDIDIHVHKSRRYRLGFYAYEVGEALALFWNYDSYCFYRGLYLYHGLGSGLYRGGQAELFFRLAKFLHG